LQHKSFHSDLKICFKLFMLYYYQKGRTVTTALDGNEETKKK
jgi:hypothetical protein